MERLTTPSLWAFLFQVLALPSYIPLSYLAYRWVRAPQKRKWVKQSLAQLGISQTDQFENTIAGDYHLKHYFWPVVLAYVFTSLAYTATHPYPIRLGMWVGVLEEMIDTGTSFPLAIVAGRILFWGWLGAYVYSFHLTWRRFLTYDLTPSVYIFTSNRFLLAFAVGAIVALGVGMFSLTAGVSPEVNFVALCVVTFFVGFFPEQGINWFTATAKKTLRQQGGIAKEIRLSEIEGLSIWHQGRLKQAGIENVQNLAAADIPALVVELPFTINQIIDWVDQALLLVYTSPKQFASLANVGVFRASNMLSFMSDGKELHALADAAGLDRNQLKLLARSLQSAFNIKLVLSFRSQTSVEASNNEASAAHKTDVQPSITEPLEEAEVFE
jgi:hypothetical protein